MIQITAQMRVRVAIEPVDGRKGIDSLVRLCQDKLPKIHFPAAYLYFGHYWVSAIPVRRDPE